MTRDELKARLKRVAETQVAYRYEVRAPGLSSAVLALFALDIKGDAQLLLTQRSESLNHHRGQNAFPGGICEPEDGGDPEVTALREAFEEVGLDPTEIETIAVFPELSTMTGFTIQPVVGCI